MQARWITAKTCPEAKLKELLLLPLVMHMHCFTHLYASAVVNLRTYRFWSGTNSYSVLTAKMAAKRFLGLQPSIPFLHYFFMWPGWGEEEGETTINIGQKGDWVYFYFGVLDKDWNYNMFPSKAACH